jgi:RNA polymerase sigma factor (TIGR02999 family)
LFEGAAVRPARSRATLEAFVIAMPDARTITLLLRELADGEKQAFDRLLPLVYGELRRIAEAQLRSERPGHTLQPTALVHEVYVRMVGREQLSFNDRAHFLGVAAHTMRRVLIDHARIRNALKRDSGRQQVPIDQAGEIRVQRPSVLIAVGDALDTLEKQNPLMARLIELRYFGGLTAEESGVVVNLPPKDVRRELRLAQAWLRRELDAAPPA